MHTTTRALLLSGTLALTAFGATAQNGIHYKPGGLPWHDAEALIRQATGEGPAAKGAGTGSRVFSNTYYLANGSGVFLANDSQRYKYASSGTANYNQILQFAYGGASWSPGNRTDYIYNNQSTVSYAGMNGLTWNTATATYDSSWKTTYTFNAAGYPITALGMSWNTGTASYANSSQGLYTRNAANQVTDVIFKSWTSGAWVNSSRTTYTRNTQGSVTQELSSNWSTATNAWVADRRYDNTYDNTGLHMTGQTLLIWNTGSASWVPNSNYIYALNSSSLTSKLYSFNWNAATNAWDSVFRISYNYDAAGNSLQEVTEVKGGAQAFSNFSKMMNSYNTGNQPLVSTMYLWSNNAWIITGGTNVNTCVQYKWYYEPYTTTGIAANAAAGATVKLYPVPAADALYLSVSWDEAQACTATLSDISGKVYQQINNAAAGSAYNATLNTAGLPAGNYMLQIAGSKGAMVSRMVTVAH